MISEKIAKLILRLIAKTDSGGAIETVSDLVFAALVLMVIGGVAAYFVMIYLRG